MASAVLKSEFQKSNLFYDYHDNRVFYSAHWKLPHPILFVLVRLLLSTYSIFALIHYFVELTSHSNLMIYFTTWSYILLTSHLAVAALLSVICYRKVHYRRLFHPHNHDTTNTSPADSHCIEIPQRSRQVSVLSNNGKLQGNSFQLKNNENLPAGSGSHTTASAKLPENTPWYFKLSWCLSNVNMGSAPIVTSIYFTAIYPTVGGEVGLIDTNVHVLNTVFILIDFLVSARPVRLLHVVAPILYGLCWLLFSVIYWSTDHNHIVYDMIDWNKAGVTMGWVVGLLFLILVIKAIYFILYRVKLWLYSVIHRENYFVDVHRDLK